MNSIGIELPKQTIDAILNGASMFIVPIDFSLRPKHREYNHFCIKCDSYRAHIHLGDGKYKCTYCRREYYSNWKMFEKGDGAFEDLVYQIPGTLKVDDEFFIQSTEYAEPFNLDNKNKSVFRRKVVIVDVEIKAMQDITFKEKEILTNCNDESKVLCQDEHDEGVIWLFGKLYNYHQKQYVFLYTVKRK